MIKTCKINKLFHGYTAKYQFILQYIGVKKYAEETRYNYIYKKNQFLLCKILIVVS